MLNLQENPLYKSSDRNSQALKGEQIPALPPRQKEILMGRAMGKTQGEIAKDLGISPETVKTHISTADYKLGASGVADAISEAIVRGEINSQILASQYNFNNYHNLTSKQKVTLDAITEVEDVTVKTLAYRMQAKPQTIKNRLSGMYKILDIPRTISQAWLFAILMPEDLRKIQAG